MNFKRILSLLLAVLLVLSVAACGNTVESNKTVTITDHADRKVEIKGTPEKIVSGYYIATSLLIALDLDEKLVGIEAKANTRPIYSLAAPELLELPNVGTAKEFNLEGCIALEPDLVILPLKLKSAAEQLEEMGIPAICVNPENDELFKETVTMVAEATGVKDRAEKLLKYKDDALKELADIVKDAEKPSVYLAGNSSFLSTAGPLMYQNTLLENAGAVNAAGEITDNYWAEISYEQLLLWNPEYIVIAPGADYTAEDICADEALKDLKAVKENKIIVMPTDYEAWDSPVPSAFLGSLFIANAIHGDIFTAEAFEAKLKDFYKTFYGFDA